MSDSLSGLAAKPLDHEACDDNYEEPAEMVTSWAVIHMHLRSADDYEHFGRASLEPLHLVPAQDRPQVGGFMCIHFEFESGVCQL